MPSDPSVRALDPPNALPPGTRLGEFEIVRVLGVGGFAIVYLAFDHSLEREVAVKEYMPGALAGRTETQHVSLRSQSDSDTFALGLRSFVNEGRMLARFDHPSLLKVHRFWEANGTAYMAMPVFRGRTLRDVRTAMAQPPAEGWLRALTMPLLGALEKLHEAGVYHRDIAPDNIMLEDDGRPVLLDFGAARRVIGDKSQTLTAILKPAYAPIEQYAEAGSVRQGPWTDLYALGATLHFLLLGRPPSPATARAVQDDQAPLSGQPLPGCSAEFLHVVDWMLAPRPGDRPQSVAALRDVLEGRAAAPARRPAAPVPESAWERTVVLAPGEGLRTQPPRAAVDDDDPKTVVVPRSALPPPPALPPSPTPRVPPSPLPSPLPSPTPLPPPSPTPLPPPSATPLPPPPPPRRPAAGAGGAAATAVVTAPAAPAPTRWPLAAALGVIVLAIAGTVLLWPRPAAQPPVDATAPAPPPAASAAAAPASAPAVAAESPPPVTAAPAPVEAPASIAPPRPATSAASRPTPRPSRPPPTSMPTAPPTAEAQRPAVTEAPKPASQAAPEPPPKPAIEAPARVAGPTERCGSRVLLSLWICIERECGKPELRQHPECVKWRADQAEKANPTR